MTIKKKRDPIKRQAASTKRSRLSDEQIVKTCSKNKLLLSNSIYGLRFQCLGSGKCCRCRDGYGYVYLSLADRRQLSKLFGIHTLSFTITYTEKTDGLFHLKRFKKNCPFLENKRCTVYRARPIQCRTWPFWPENIIAAKWKQKILNYCPGVGKGELYSKSEISRIFSKLKGVPGI